MRARWRRWRARQRSSFLFVFVFVSVPVHPEGLLGSRVHSLPRLADLALSGGRWSFKGLF